MNVDLINDKPGLTREFLRNQFETYSLNTPRFVYYADKHPRLKEKLDRLIDQWFIENISTGAQPVYRMSQNFIDFASSVGIQDEALRIH